MYHYNDGLRHGGRSPLLWICGHNQIHMFEGRDIPGVVRIVEEDYEKNGKWSNTDYSLDIAQGYHPILLVAPLHGRVWPQNDRYSAYVEVIQPTGVSFEVFDETLRAHFPKAYDRMIKSEEVAESLEAAAGKETELVTLSTCCPTRKAGWQWLKVTDPDGHSTYVENPWEIGTRIGDCAVIVGYDSRPGFRGGSRTYTFSVTPGTTVEVRPGGSL